MNVLFFPFLSNSGMWVMVDDPTWPQIGDRVILAFRATLVK